MPTRLRRTKRPQADQTSSRFVGVERIISHQGSFVLQDHGTLAGITVRGEWFVVPGSGTGELTDLRGEGGLTPNLVNVPRLPLTIGSSPDLT